MSKKPVWALGYALRLAGVPCAEEIAMMLCRDCKHVAAEPVEENRVEATPEAKGSYDTVVYCTRCGAEISRTTTTIPKLEFKGYLYNGNRLFPQIPEIGFEEGLNYVYWAPFGTTTSSYGVLMSEQPLYFHDSTGGDSFDGKLVNASENGVKYRYWWGIQEGDPYRNSNYWYKGTLKAGDYNSNTIGGARVFWSNYDIYKAGGDYDSGFYPTDEIFFRKCDDPVPVYE